MPDGLLSAKTAVVTGGGQGIGLGISRAFLDAGASLLIAQRSSPPSELTDRKDVLWVEADLSRPDCFSSIADAAEKTLGRVDVLVNNAGIMFESSLEAMRIEAWQQMIAVNLTAPVFLTQSLLPLLRQSEGCVINIGSIEGIGANPEHIAYCATKGGVHAMTRAMAVDLGKDGIRCNAIAPGWIRSALSDRYIEAQDNPETAWAGLYKMHPLGRVGEPDDVGKLAVYLASEAADFMTGQVIVLDGGRSSKLPLPF